MNNKYKIKIYNYIDLVKTIEELIKNGYVYTTSRIRDISVIKQKFNSYYINFDDCYYIIVGYDYECSRVFYGCGPTWEYICLYEDITLEELLKLDLVKL